MKPNTLKKLLLSEIKSVSDHFTDFCITKGKDFTRNRKLSFETVIKTIIGMESKSLTNEIINALLSRKLDDASSVRLNAAG